MGMSLIGPLLGTAMDWVRTDFPRTVRIETTNHCNAACTFCPRETIGRAKTFMDQDLFERIVDQCADGGCRLIHMHNFGEPLLDKRLPERIRYAKQKGIPRVKLFCNGALLRGKMAEGLVESGLDEIKVSIDGSNAQEFNELRVGLDHTSVVDNTRNFKQLRDDRQQAHPTIVAACVVASDKRRSEALLQGVVDRIDWSKLHNWAGARKYFGKMIIRKPCDRLWRTFTVLVNGDVALCCLDHSGREILGNCRTDSIRDIWNNFRYRELRRLHRTGRQSQIPLCSNCSKSYL